MNILVTGGAGFIGSHTVDALIEGCHRVVVLDDLSTGKRDQIHPRAIFVDGDIRTADISELIKARNITHCIHLAAQISVPVAVKDPIKDAEINVIGTLRLLQACAQANVQRFVFVSSGGAIYKESADGIAFDENHEAAPKSPYGMSKLCAESYAQFYARELGLPVTILRYSNVYGPRQGGSVESGVIAIFTKSLVENRDVVIFGNGEQVRDFIYVKDVVQMNINALIASHNGVFNIGTASKTTINELFDVLKQISGSTSQKSYAPEREGDIFASCEDASKAAKVFGWKPKYNLEDGLRETISYQRGLRNLS